MNENLSEDMTIDLLDAVREDDFHRLGYHFRSGLKSQYTKFLGKFFAQSTNLCRWSRSADFGGRLRTWSFAIKEDRLAVDVTGGTITMNGTVINPNGKNIFINGQQKTLQDLKDTLYASWRSASILARLYQRIPYTSRPA